MELTANWRGKGEMLPRGLAEKMKARQRERSFVKSTRSKKVQSHITSQFMEMWDAYLNFAGLDF
ncbi:MAG: hypothetical protein GX587_07675 [Bacteroidales bacterium]|nr:hypothetical protein [Bacteroidales bacterium]